MKNIFQTPKPTPKRLVSLAMLIALAFIVGKFSIPIIPQQLVVSLTFIVNTIIGMIAGPIWGFISLAILDVVDNLSSGEGNFIIWWTLMEAVQGFFYGFFFYGRELRWSSKKDWLHVTIATLITMLIGTFIFTPLLIQIYFDGKSERPMGGSSNLSINLLSWGGRPSGWFSPQKCNEYLHSAPILRQSAPGCGQRYC